MFWNKNLFMLFIGMATCYQSQYNDKRFDYQGSSEIMTQQSPTIYYTKHRPGRRVCATPQAVTRQEPTVVSYSQSAYQPFTERCQDNKICRGIKLVYETAYKTIYHTRTSRQDGFSCCPGWSQVAKVNHGCHQPQCRRPCHNGGTCTKPDVCSCKTGFAGALCENDVNECERDKPCDQACHNTAGSYRCECREGFTLLADGVSCLGRGQVATEAKDLEGDFEILAKRLTKLEKLMDGPSKQFPSDQLRDRGLSIADLSKKLDTSIASITRRLSIIERHQESQDRHPKKSKCSDTELHPLRIKLISLERKIDACNCKFGYNGIFS